MKPKIIELKQAPVVLVELDKFTDVDCPIEIHGNKLVSSQNKGFIINTTKIPQGNWKLLGVFSDLTEEQICEVLNIDFCDICTLEKKGVYGTDGGYAAGCEGSRCDYVREELHVKMNELLKSENVYTENPYGFEPDEYDDEFWEGIDHEKTVFLEWKYEEIANKWQEAQSRTIDPKRTVVLIRKEGK